MYNYICDFPVNVQLYLKGQDNDKELKFLQIIFRSNYQIRPPKEGAKPSEMILKLMEKVMKFLQPILLTTLLM